MLLLLSLPCILVASCLIGLYLLHVMKVIFSHGLIATPRGCAGRGTIASDVLYKWLMVVFWLLDGKEENDVIFGTRQICDSWCGATVRHAHRLA